MRVKASKRLRRTSSQLLLVLGFGLFSSSSALLLAKDRIGLPYTVVTADPIVELVITEVPPDSYGSSSPSGTDVYKAMDEHRFDEDFVEIAAEPITELAIKEVAPDSYGSSYRSGIDVYKMMAEHSFDDEPMLVVYAKADPAKALPQVVVVPASIVRQYNHITAAAEIFDPIAQGEDKIYLEINGLPENPVSSEQRKPRPRRFFSESANL